MRRLVGGAEVVTLQSNGDQNQVPLWLLCPIGRRLKESKDGGVDADGSYEDGNGQGYVDDDGTWYGGGSTSKKFGERCRRV